MHPTFAEEMARQRIDELWRIADEARRGHIRELRERSDGRNKPGRLRRLASRLTAALRRLAGNTEAPAIDCR